MNLPQIFFITGLPRSRTAWLANLFTHGPSFCFHDLTAECERVSQFANHFADLARTREDLTHIGVSDSGLGLFALPLLELFPEAKWILVRRDRDEAQQSFEKLYSNLDLQLHDASAHFRTLDCALNALTKSLPRQQVRTVDFAALEWPETARDLWNFVVRPSTLNSQLSTPFDSDRWELLHKLRINPAIEKTPPNLARGRRLLEEAMN